MIKKISFMLLLISAIAMLASCTASDPVGTKYVGFARCLKAKGAVMYGAYWCSHCQNQKAMLGKLGVAEMNYVECDPQGPKAKPGLCVEKKIEGFPTWEFADGTRVEGETTLEILSQKTGCELPIPMAPKN